jgi:MinD-like ATPase involved in chromosome partitioning or flagellar assembly
MPLNDFYKNTTKNFYVDLIVSGTAPDISSDTMMLYLKDSDEIILTSSADMTTSGAAGRAVFNISSSLTNVTASCYTYEIVWHRNTDGSDYVIDKSSINIKERVSGSV